MVGCYSRTLLQTRKIHLSTKLLMYVSVTDSRLFPRSQRWASTGLVGVQDATQDFYSKWYSCREDHPRLQVFSFQDPDYAMPLPSGLQCFCKEIRWEPYDSLVINSFFFFFLPLEFSLYLQLFNYNMSWCRSVLAHLFQTLYASCIWISVSFFRFEKFSAVISSNTFLIPFSLFLLEPLLWVAWGFILSYRYHIILICLLVWCSDWVISISLLSRSLILLHCSLCHSLLLVQLLSL